MVKCSRKKLEKLTIENLNIWAKVTSQILKSDYARLRAARLYEMENFLPIPYSFTSFT